MMKKLLLPVLAALLSLAACKADTQLRVTDLDGNLIAHINDPSVLDASMAQWKKRTPVKLKTMPQFETILEMTIDNHSEKWLYTKTGFAKPLGIDKGMIFRVSLPAVDQILEQGK